MIVVEDGSGISNAESYSSVAVANIYHSNLGNDEWLVLTELEKEQALRKGFNFLNHLYNGKIKGIRATSIQRGDWPRDYVYLEEPIGLISNSTIPQEWIDANIELALRSVVDDLMPDNSTRIKKEKVDVLEVEYDENSRESAQYTQVDMMLSKYLETSKGASSITETVQLG